MRFQYSCRATIIVVLCLIAWLPSARAVEATRPNVVFILADDLGYGDVKCFGGDRCQIDTPHFDRLAREGMRFTNAHAIGSVCVPSRIGIMTGRYAWRFGGSGPGGPWGFLGTRLAVGQQQAWKTAVEAHGRKLRSREELLQPAFVQLFNLAADPSETTDVAADHGDIVHELHELFQSQVKSGRSTPGPALANDRDNIRAFSAVPPLVWQRPAAKSPVK